MPSFNRALFESVPDDASHILDVGCAAGLLGEALKAARPGRVVSGLERDHEAAGKAMGRLDRVFVRDACRDEIPLLDASLDAVLFGDVIEHLADPLQALRLRRRLLKPNGCVLLSLPNVQHHSMLTALLRAQWQPQPSGLLDRTHVRFYSWADAFKLLLDASFAPSIARTIDVPGSPALKATLTPLLAHLGLDAQRVGRYLDAYQFILRGDPLPEPPEMHVEPITFAACVDDEEIARANLLASPDLVPGGPHEALLVRDAANAADGLTAAIAQAKHSVVVCLHQDVYLPLGWPRRFWAAWRQAQSRFGSLGVAGVFGVRVTQGQREEAGRVADRDRWLSPSTPLPALVDTLDELLLAVPHDTPLRFEPALGWHLYGADLCLQAKRLGRAIVALDAPCLHHSRGGAALPTAFRDSGRVLARKWPTPIVTPCAVIDHSWT